MTTTTGSKGRGPRGGYRLPGETRLGRVRLAISDLRRSVEFYEGTLGLRAERSGEGTALLRAGSDPEVLVELVEEAGARPVPGRGRLGLYHFAILVPDRAALGRFVRHLGERGVRAGASDHLVSEAIYLDDPDGLGIEVYADRPRERWQYHDGQLAMATNPLDMTSLLAAARPERWDGIPAGARIGHVHLHVGALEEAERFYHHGLGLDRVVWSYPGALFLSAGGYHHHLGLNTWARGAEPAGRGDARLLDWELRLPTDAHREATESNMRAQGHTVQNAGDASSVRDPWGIEVRLTTA